MAAAGCLGLVGAVELAHQHPSTDTTASLYSTLTVAVPGTRRSRRAWRAPSPAAAATGPAFPPARTHPSIHPPPIHHLARCNVPVAARHVSSPLRGETCAECVTSLCRRGVCGMSHVPVAAPHVRHVSRPCGGATCARPGGGAACAACVKSLARHVRYVSRLCGGVEYAVCVTSLARHASLWRRFTIRGTASMWRRGM